MGYIVVTGFVQGLYPGNKNLKEAGAYDNGNTLRAR
jgi:hypothetical protein